MTGQPPKVGVCVPVRNSIRWVENLVRSVEAQTYRGPIRIYAVDDCSTDGTWRFMSYRWADTHCMVFNDRRLGWPRTLNRAVWHAIQDQCSWVFLANADDWLRLDCIERCVAAAPGYDWVNCDGQQVGGLDIVMESATDPPLSAFADHTPLPSFGLVSAAAWDAVGGYSDDIAVPGMSAGYEDLEFWVKLIKAGYHGTRVPEPLYYYRIHDQQLSRETTARHREAIAAVRRKHPELAAPEEKP